MNNLEMERLSSTEGRLSCERHGGQAGVSDLDRDASEAPVPCTFTIEPPSLRERWIERFGWARRLTELLPISSLSWTGEPWRLSIIFSGIGGPEHAGELLRATHGISKPSWTLACERDGHCQRVLGALRDPAPLLGDITSVLPSRLREACVGNKGDLESLSDQLRRLDSEPLPDELVCIGGSRLTWDLGDICISGIPCIDFSPMGRQAREQGPTRVLLIAWAPWRPCTTASRSDR